MIKLLFFYDDWCPKCSQFAHFIKKNDIFQKTEAIPLRKSAEIQRDLNINSEKASQQMASFDGKTIFYGFDSIYLIFKRIPLLWGFVPILFLLKLSRMGHFLYNEYAVKRKIIPIHCDPDTCLLKD